MFTNNKVMHIRSHISKVKSLNKKGLRAGASGFESPLRHFNYPLKLIICNAKVNIICASAC